MKIFIFTISQLFLNNYKLNYPSKLPGPIYVLFIYSEILQCNLNTMNIARCQKTCFVIFDVLYEISISKETFLDRYIIGFLFLKNNRAALTQTSPLISPLLFKNKVLPLKQMDRLQSLPGNMKRKKGMPLAIQLYNVKLQT